MRELFDINLLTQVTSLDRKFSITKEQQGLKRKLVEREHPEEKRNKPLKQNKGVDGVKRKNEASRYDENEEEHRLDITV